MLATCAMRAPANAQSVPPLGRPAIAGSPLERGFAGAAESLERARTVNPLAAQRAYALDLRAHQQAAQGDRAGALATTSLARAEALAAGSSHPTTLAPALPVAVAQSPISRVPLVNDGVVLPRDLLAARGAIERVAATGHDPGLALAKLYYRHALDAYLSGDRVRALDQARIARTLALHPTGSLRKGP